MKKIKEKDIQRYTDLQKIYTKFCGRKKIGDQGLTIGSQGQKTNTQLTVRTWHETIYCFLFTIQ